MNRLTELEDESVQCVVTSPPYWGLRDYGIPPSVWPVKASQGVVRCSNGDHLWSDAIPGSNRGGSGTPTDKNNRGEGYGRDAERGSWCQLCGAWRGCFGLEPTPDLYIAHGVQIFGEIKRVLRGDGLLWLNMGDSYAGAPSGSFSNGNHGVGLHGEGFRCNKPFDTTKASGLKPKDLCGIPWMLAFALRADGWYLRCDVIWAKPNPMPESVTDRPTKSHEYIFLLSKSERYFYDAEAIKEDAIADHLAGNNNHRGKTAYEAGDEKQRTKVGLVDYAQKWKQQSIANHLGDIGGDGELIGKRNKRSVWNVATQPFPEAHFATFPEELITPCIQAGTSEKGCCSECRAPWERVVESDTRFESGSGKAGNKPNGKHAGSEQAESGDYDIRMGPVKETRTLGWEPTCKCAATIQPCTVLDPFCGSGTTGVVALRYHRNFIGVELNPEYAAMAERRIRGDQPLFNEGQIFSEVNS